ncbi:MAG: FKBP-type peptidyl-prolyl cis-trans isomerase [Gemmatimonadota bacterium]
MRLHLTPLSVLLIALAGCRTAAPIAPVNTLPAAIPPLAGPRQVALALEYIDAKLGLGAAVGERQCVFVHYTGWLRDGTKFDSSRDTMPNGTPRTPIAFPLGFRRVIAGWDLGFDGIKVGGQRRLFIPYALAYGESGRPPVIPAKAELIFDIELMAVADTLPRDAAAPARGASPQCPTWAVVKDRPTE